MLNSLAESAPRVTTIGRHLGNGGSRCVAVGERRPSSSGRLDFATTVKPLLTGTAFSSLGLSDATTIGDSGVGLAALAPAAAGFAARQELPELLDLLPRPIDEGIDGLRADLAQPGLVAGLQPSRARRPRDPSANQPWSGDHGGPAICSGDQPSFKRSITKRSSRSSRSSNASRSRRAKYDPSAKLGW